MSFKQLYQQKNNELTLSDEAREKLYALANAADTAPRRHLPKWTVGALCTAAVLALVVLSGGLWQRLMPVSRDASNIGEQGFADTQEFDANNSYNAADEATEATAAEKLCTSVARTEAFTTVLTEEAFEPVDLSAEDITKNEETYDCQPAETGAPAVRDDLFALADSMTLTAADGTPLGYRFEFTAEAENGAGFTLYRSLSENDDFFPVAIHTENHNDYTVGQFDFSLYRAGTRLYALTEAKGCPCLAWAEADDIADIGIWLTFIGDFLNENP